MKTHLKTEQIKQLPQALVAKMVTQALAEDIDQGDINALLIAEDETAHGQVITRQKTALCGHDFVNEVFRQVDPNLQVFWHAHDGDRLLENKPIFEVKGKARSILSAERNALNFLQMLCAVATQTHYYVDALAGAKTQILDTRKTIPGFRLAQKYAVCCGGGMNHRIGLFDAFLIKENHIAACGGSISLAVESARAIAPEKMVEVEVENFIELEQALAVKADVIMLDNFSISQMAQAVQMAYGKAQIEASGNITIEEIKEVANTGVDFISIGALTKNIQAIDLSMRFIS